MGEMRHIYKILVRKSEGKGSLRRHRCKFQNTSQRNSIWGYGWGFIWSRI